MKISISDYKITTNVKIQDLNTFPKFNIDEAALKKDLKKTRKKLGELQDTIYAHGKYAVLLCFQGMDTAGKDSLIREVFKDFNVRGVEVHSFKVPTELELKHDFLWRHYIALPAKGKFGVFNRTHYENVLVTRVHPEYILGENLPDIHSVADVNDKFWDQRFEQINNFEQHLTDNGTLIFKFFLNLSKEEQKNRLLRRLDNQEKNWKFSSGDLSERKLWSKYQASYEAVLNKTSKPSAPWYNIPADSKPAARSIVVNILLKTLSKYSDIKEPELDAKTKLNLNSYRQQLNGES
jgi:PPK2 family polyphosphate:nucleotide phosphotransferase